MLLSLISGYVLIGILFYLEYRYESSRTSTTLQTSADDQGTSRLLLLIWLIALVVSPFWILLVSAAAMPLLFSWVGLSLLIVAIALLRWTTYVNPFYLRAMATTDDHFICTDGPYRTIRHPCYLAFLLAWVGFGFMTNNWISLAMVTVLMLWGYLLRILAEEQMMLDRFGVDYQQYMNETYR
ncbi:hypothetical protein [Parasitella parasitica]|uniref:Protein-S-isoprenylcysteine O-methyltransferase n=1 Tax=Parasitella parasitica TaxID=35722 RepID=A0A0B7NE52_9FUNG|nr:hypothetical protein [Parasitella parasitica]